MTDTDHVTAAMVQTLLDTGTNITNESDVILALVRAGFLASEISGRLGAVMRGALLQKYGRRAA